MSLLSYIDPQMVRRQEEDAAAPRPNFDICNDGVTDECPVDATIYGDYFTRSACIFLVACYILLLIVQLFFTVKSRTWSFGISLSIGIFMEAAGWGARVYMVNDPWDFNTFVVQYLCLLLAPTFIAAAISVTFKYIVVWYGSEWSVIRASLYPWIFIGTDVASIMIQMVGGGISATATNATSQEDRDRADLGETLVTAGVVFQVVNMAFCGGLIVIYAVRRNLDMRKGRGRIAKSGNGLRYLDGQLGTATYEEDRKSKIFVFALAVAFMAVLFRCSYRVPEMTLGWGSDLMRTEWVFLIFDGACILLSVFILTAVHPHNFFPFLGKKLPKKPKSSRKSRKQQKDLEMNNISASGSNESLEPLTPADGRNNIPTTAYQPTAQAQGHPGWESYSYGGYAPPPATGPQQDSGVLHYQDPAELPMGRR